jgi:hypothetical protein
MKQPVVAVVKFESIDRTLRSVALAVAYQQLTTIRWVDFHILPGLYGYWKVGPGAVSVDQPHIKAIKKQADFNYRERWKHALRILGQSGFLGLETYLLECERIRDKAWRDLQTNFAQAQRDNREAIRISEGAIRDWAAVKFKALSSLAILTVPAGIVLSGSAALLATGIGVGTSMICSVAKNWSQAQGSKAVAIDGTKEVFKYGVGYANDTKLTTAGLGMIDEGNSIIRSVQGSVRAQSEALVKFGLPTGKKSVRQAGTAIMRQQGRDMIKQGGKMASAGRFGIPVVFAAWDIYSAWGDYKAETNF